MICPCWDYTTSRRTSECPGRPCLLAVCLHRHPIKWMAILKKNLWWKASKKTNREVHHISPLPLHGSRAHFVRQPPTNSIINKNAWYHKKPVEIQSTNCLNDSSELSNCCNFITFRQSNKITENQIHSFLVFNEQGTVYQELLHWSTKYTMEKSFPVWIFQCHANNAQNRAGSHSRKYWSLHDGIFIFKTRRFFSAFNASLTMHWSCCAKMISAHAKRSIVKMHAYWGEGW